jgi:hypothetical protein
MKFSMQYIRQDVREATVGTQESRISTNVFLLRAGYPFNPLLLGIWLARIEDAESDCGLGGTRQCRSRRLQFRSRYLYIHRTDLVRARVGWESGYGIDFTEPSHCGR